MDRRREENIQLRTVLANVSLDGDQSFSSLLARTGGSGAGGANSDLPEAEELFTAYETQKSVIGQLQDALSEERSRARELEVELKAELTKLTQTCTEQQQVINAAINKGSPPANHTEACLQHEVTRLTGENFDLREKIETLGDTIKRLKRQLKSYMKKLNEVGGKLCFTVSYG